MQQPTPPSKSKILYNAVSKDYDLGSFEEFESKLQDPEKRKAFYDGVGSEFKLGSFEEFEAKLQPSVKKKEDTTKLPESTSTDTPLVSEPETETGLSDGIELQEKNKTTLEKGVDFAKNLFSLRKAQAKDMFEHFKAGGTETIAALSGIPNFLNKMVVSAAIEVTSLTNPEESKEFQDYLNSLPEKEREIFINNLDFTGRGQASADVQNYLTDLSQEISAKTIQYEGNIIDDILNGNLDQASARIANGISGSALALALAAAPGGIALIGAGSASQKQESLEREGENLDSNSILNSIVSGTAEAAFEKVTAGLLKPIKGVFKGNSELATKFSESFVTNTLKSMGLEGSSEAMTTISQQLSDSFFKDESLSVTSKEFWKNVTDSAIIGGIMGGGISFATVGAQKVMTKETKEKVSKMEDISNKIDADIQKDIPNDLRNQLKATKEVLDSEKDKLVQSEFEKFKSMPKEERDKLGNLESKLDEIKQEYDAIKNNPELSDASKNMLLDKKSKEAEALLESKKKLINKPDETVDAKEKTPAKETEKSKVEETTPESETVTQESEIESKPNQINDVNENGTSSEIEGDITNSNQIKNETTQVEDTTTDGNISVGDNINQPEAVQPTVESESIKGEVKRVNPKGVKGEFDVETDSNGNVAKIINTKGREVPKFIERTLKNGKKKLVRNGNYSKIEAEAIGAKTDNQIAEENKSKIKKAIESFEPSNEYEAALMALASGSKVSLFSIKKETGLKQKETKWASGFNKDSGLPSIEVLAENIVQDSKQDLDLQEVRNNLIDIISTNNSINSVRSEISEIFTENSVKQQEQELFDYKNSLSEQDLAKFESIKAEDDYLRDLSYDEKVEYYEQEFQKNNPENVRERESSTSSLQEHTREETEISNGSPQEELGSSNEANSQMARIASTIRGSVEKAKGEGEVTLHERQDTNKNINTPPTTNVNLDSTTGDSKKQAFSTRAYNSENLNEGAKEKLKELGLSYDVENQSLAQKNAENIIKEIGITDAYILAKEGQIRGGARTWIQAQMFEDMNQKIFDAEGSGDLDLVNQLIEEQAEIMKDFAEEKTKSGQELAMLNRIYKKFDIKYDLNFAKQQWSKKFDSEMPTAVEARLRKQESNIKKLQEEIKSLEDKIGTMQEQQAVTNIQEVIKRHQQKKPSASSLKKAAAALRNTKFTKSINDLSKLQSDPTGLVKGIWDGAIEVIATALDAGSNVEQALKKGVSEIKNSDWYKGLSSKNKKEAIKIAKKDFEEIINKYTSVPEIDLEVIDGAVKIPQSLLYELVASGVDNISDLTNAVFQAMESNYPELTKREIRDAITGYGKQINETKDAVKSKLSKLKTDGKQISALEDLAEGKRPKRSGRKPKDLTAEQRNRVKKIRELLKSLPIDDSVDKSKLYKSALEAYKSKLKNRIKDLEDAIKKDERIIKEKKNTPLDEEAETLIKQRDELQKQYDDYFGKPYKSDETLINEIIRRKEKSLREVQLKLEYAKQNKAEQPKAEKRNVSDPKIDALEQEIESKKEDLRDVYEEVGIAEAKRLKRAKGYTERRIEELNEKIRTRDFSKRKPKTYKYDKGLIELKKKLLLEKVKYDIEFEKHEYKRLSVLEKSIDHFFKAFGTFKGLKATADLSAMLRQGILLGSSNPKEYAKATVDMHKFAYDGEKYKTWIAEIESSDDFVYMKEDGLSITDTSGDVLRSEERFVGNLLASKIMVAGMNINVIGKVTDISERAYGGFLNSLRVSVYRKLVEKHESLGFNRQEHPKVFKSIAKMVNNTTGRGSMSSDKRVAKVLNALFFSPRMITGMVGVIKDMGRKDSTPYLRKQAAKSLATFIGYQFVMKILISQAYQLLVMPFSGEDEEDITQDMNPVSTDFNKLKINDTRYDVSSGWGIAARTMARFILNEKSSGIDAKNVSYDDMYGKTSFGEVGDFFMNKMSPLAAQIYKLKTKQHPTEFRGKIEDATVGDYMQALFIPLTVMELADGIKNDTPKSKLAFDNILTIYGIGVQNYESGKPKNKKDKKGKEETTTTNSNSL